MTYKPEALRLADECDEGMVDFAEVAAELRRLHEVVQRLLRERNINLESAQRDTARIAELEQQRNELLEALRQIAEQHGQVMNERIDELAKQANAWYPKGYPSGEGGDEAWRNLVIFEKEDLLKFSESIIRECVCGTTECGPRNLARAAIAKVEGEKK